MARRIVKRKLKITNKGTKEIISFKKEGNYGLNYQIISLTYSSKVSSKVIIFRSYQIFHKILQYLSSVWMKAKNFR